MARLELTGVQKTYPGGIVAARNVDLEVASGELFVLVGPSGSGKSTLLRLIAGLEALDAGMIHLGDRRIDELAPRDRHLAMVFQDLVVYPHLNVFENIAFGLRARRVRRAEVETLVRETARFLGLTEVLGRSPTTLSGGQKRRVTLARALVLRPSLYLFDEPFTGLDAPLRASIRAQLLDLHRGLAATMVLVTHDQAEALALADRIAIVDAGRIVQVGRPVDVYEAPRTRFVAQFLGQPPMAILRRQVASRAPDLIQLDPSPRPGSTWSIPRASRAGRTLARRSGPVDLGLRTEAVAIVASLDEAQALEPHRVATTATLERLESTGQETIATLSCSQELLSARLPARTPLQVGATVAVALDLDQAHWFDPATGDRIDSSSP